MVDGKKGSWIPVKRRLPIKDGLYHIRLHSTYERMATYNVRIGWVNVANNSKVLYWFEETR